MVQGDQWRLWSTGTKGQSPVRQHLALPQLWLRSAPWPGNSVHHGVGKKEKKEKRKKLEAEMGVQWLQTKKSLGPPEGARSILPARDTVLPDLDFRLPASRAVRQ